MARLKESERDLREKLAASPSDFRALLGLGTVLSQLDRLVPDGGKRVPEALQAYQRALDQAKEGQVQAFVLAQMGELLLGARQPRQAAEVLNQTLPLAERSGLGKTETVRWASGHASVPGGRGAWAGACAGGPVGRLLCLAGMVCRLRTCCSSAGSDCLCLPSPGLLLLPSYRP